MPTYRLHIEYDGEGFHGWQVQPGQRTVQGELGAALGRLCRGPVRVVGAGRTDAGVHARGQVASFESAVDLEPIRLLRALQGLLPDDVHVWQAGRATAGFSARASAVWRRYAYRMLRQRSPLRRRWHHELSHAVDAQAMAGAAEFFRGEHDFTAFAAADSAGADRICVVDLAEVRDETQVLIFEIRANRFLHNMVRRLAGVLVEVGRGRLALAEVDRILADRDRSRGGPCLPACGLCLLDVGYPPDPEFDASAVVDGESWAP